MRPPLVLLRMNGRTNTERTMLQISLWKLCGLYGQPEGTQCDYWDRLSYYCDFRNGVTWTDLRVFGRTGADRQIMLQRCEAAFTNWRAKEKVDLSRDIYDVTYLRMCRPSVQFQECCVFGIQVWNLVMDIVRNLWCVGFYCVHHE